MAKLLALALLCAVAGKANAAVPLCGYIKNGICYSAVNLSGDKTYVGAVDACGNEYDSVNAKLYNSGGDCASAADDEVIAALAKGDPYFVSAPELEDPIQFAAGTEELPSYKWGCGEDINPSNQFYDRTCVVRQNQTFSATRCDEGSMRTYVYKAPLHHSIGNVVDNVVEIQSNSGWKACRPVTQFEKDACENSAFNSNSVTPCSNANMKEWFRTNVTSGITVPVYKVDGGTAYNSDPFNLNTNTNTGVGQAWQYSVQTKDLIMTVCFQVPDNTLTVKMTGNVYAIQLETTDEDLEFKINGQVFEPSKMSSLTHYSRRYTGFGPSRIIYGSTTTVNRATEVCLQKDGSSALSSALCKEIPASTMARCEIFVNEPSTVVGFTLEEVEEKFTGFEITDFPEYKCYVSDLEDPVKAELAMCQVPLSNVTLGGEAATTVEEISVLPDWECSFTFEAVGTPNDLGNILRVGNGGKNLPRIDMASGKVKVTYDSTSGPSVCQMTTSSFSEDQGTDVEVKIKFYEETMTISAGGVVLRECNNMAEMKDANSGDAVVQIPDHGKVFPNNIVVKSAMCKGIVTDAPTVSPTMSPTSSPTSSPTHSPTKAPSQSPSSAPTSSPTYSPTDAPSDSPTKAPSMSPTASPTSSPTWTNVPDESVNFGDADYAELYKCVFTVERYERDQNTQPKSASTLFGVGGFIDKYDDAQKITGFTKMRSPEMSFTENWKIEASFDVMASNGLPETFDLASSKEIEPYTPTEVTFEISRKGNGQYVASIEHEGSNGNIVKATKNVPGPLYRWFPVGETMDIWISAVGTPGGKYALLGTPVCGSSITPNPTQAPTTAMPTQAPTDAPSKAPSKSPTSAPTESPTKSPTSFPTWTPTESPTKSPSNSPSWTPTKSPSHSPSYSPTEAPTQPIDCAKTRLIVAKEAAYNYPNRKGKGNPVLGKAVDIVEEIIQTLDVSKYGAQVAFTEFEATVTSQVSLFTETFDAAKEAADESANFLAKVSSNPRGAIDYLELLSNIENQVKGMDRPSLLVISDGAPNNWAVGLSNVKKYKAAVCEKRDLLRETLPGLTVTCMTSSGKVAKIFDCLCDVYVVLKNKSDSAKIANKFAGVACGDAPEVFETTASPCQYATKSGACKKVKKTPFGKDKPKKEKDLKYPMKQVCQWDNNSCSTMEGYTQFFN